MTNKKVETMTSEIKEIKRYLQQIGDMRPGSLTEQKRKTSSKAVNAYWQVSYTQNMKSKTEYVRSEFVEKIRNEIVEYKKFKTLIEKWVELSIDLSKERMKLLKKNK